MLSMFGKSTRVLFKDVDEVYTYIQDLAISMGYSNSVECNLTGVSCKMNLIANDSSVPMEKSDIVTNFEETNKSVKSSFQTCDEEDDLIFIGQDQMQLKFIPLNSSMKKDLCQKLNVPYICSNESVAIQCFSSNMASPRQEKQILGDGNCFFRAVSYSLTNSEDFHNIVRTVVCQHMMENKDLFELFLNSVQSMDDYLDSSQMSQGGTWATEVEIFATAHLLNTDIFTYSGGCWIRFAVNDVEPSEQETNGAIYLNHHHQNHYNVVLSVNGRDTDLTQQQSHTFFNECERRSRNRTRMQRIRHSSREMQKNSRYAEKRKELLRKKYQEDREFREEKLKLSSVRYLKDEKYQASARLQSKQRYHNDIEYQNKAKNRSKKTSHDKYTTDQEHRENEKKRNIDKYKTDQYYKESFKRKSLERYASNEQHRADVKMRSIQKYKLNAEHRENVKAKSKQKYMSDEEHRIRVNTASTERYRENQNLRETKLNAAAKRYKEDELFRSKRKLSSKNQYNSDPKVKAQKKRGSKITELLNKLN